MVKVRRPTPRGKGGGTTVVAQIVAYGKYALLGGILVFVVNVIMGDNASTRGGSGSGILDLVQQRRDEQLLREDPEDQNIVMHRRTPPNFVQERLERRQHDEEGDQHGGKLLDDHDNNEGRLSGDGEDGNDSPNNQQHQKIQYVSPNGEVLEKPEGTGPTKLGFVMDFVYERGHPKFRTEPYAKIETIINSHVATVATALSEETSVVQPCEYLSSPPEEHTNKGHSIPRLLQHEACRDPESQRPLVVYNAASFPRTWCGVSIPPQTTARMDGEACNNNIMMMHKEPVRLLEKDLPPVSGQGMSPIILHAQADGMVPSSSDSLVQVEQCSIPCLMERDMSGIGRYIQGTDWKIFYSTDDPGSSREIQIDLSKYKHDEYYSTAYFKSDVPLSRYDDTQHNLRNRPAVNFEDTIDKAVYIVDDYCAGTTSRRTRWMEVLESQYHVDSFGKCHHTKDPEVGESVDTLEGRLAIMKKYRFSMGFEVSTHKDWLTNLSYEAMLSGAVPIILGASNANRHFPKNSAIFTNDFNSWDKLAVYVNQVATNKTLWESYHAWRTDEAALAAFERKYQFTKTSAECRICSWAYAKMFGLGWDHELQQVQATYIPRQLCVDEDSGLVAKPFREVWASSGSSSSAHEPTEGAEESCKPLSSIDEKTLQSGDWSIVKSTIQHDSITDITIHDIKSDGGDEVTLTFEFNNVNNTEGACFRNSHTLVETKRGMLMSSATIQDHKSKVTVLANWETNVWSPRQGLIRVVIQASNAPELHSDEVRRIRLITEDMGQLHDKMTEYFPSSFSERMIQDFVDPLEVFYLES